MNDDEIIKYLVERCDFVKERRDQPRHGTRLRHKQHRGRAGSLYVGDDDGPYVAASGPYGQLEQAVPRSCDGPMHGYPNWKADKIQTLLEYLEVNNPPPIF